MFDKTKFVYRAYRYKYSIDSSEIQYLMSKLKLGDTCIDIGAHKGGYLYWLEKKVGKKGKVFCFEPQGKLYNYLLEIKERFDYQNVRIENKGLSDAEGTLNFHIPITNSGTSPGARIDFYDNKKLANITQIEVTTLDKYCTKNAIIPTLVKIDVEGHEWEVLNGGLDLLKKNLPSIILECENRHLKKRTIFDIFELLKSIGYHGYFYENGKIEKNQNFKIEKHQQIGEGRFWEAKAYINNFIFDRDKLI